MTYKHTKFGDSATMRSLERVAQAKGWLQEDPHLVKNAASKTPDLNPSDSLMENIIKLCNGLRNAGFDKHADQIESSFVIFKQSDQKYDISGEDGEDLIHAAHPEGGHQMEDVEGDAYIEDILEKHLKMVDVAEGEPKAKMNSSAKSVLDAVKVALGAPPLGFQEVNLPSAPSAYGRLMEMMGKSPKIELAGEGAEAAEGAAAVGGGEAAGAVGIGAIGTVAGAALIGAVGGAIAGNALFDKYLAPDQLKDAGDRLMSKAEDFRKASLWNDALGDKASSYLDNFENAFKTVMANYSAIEALQKDPSTAPTTIPQLKKLDDALMESNKWAQNLWSFADNKMDEKTFSFRFSPLTNYQDIVALANNYMQIANRIHPLIMKFLSDAVMRMSQKQQQSTKQKANQVGGSGSDSLLQDYSNVMNTIDRYSTAVQAKRQPNANKVVNYLDQIKKYVAGEQSKFNAIPAVNRDVAVSPYQDRLGKAKALLDALKSKQGLQ